MNRRFFLKLFGVTTSATSLPIFAIEALRSEVVSPERDQLDRWENFNPKGEYGNFLCLSDDFDSLSKELKLKCLDLFERDMRYEVPPNKWDKVTYTHHAIPDIGAADPYDCRATIAWKYSG